VWITETLKCTGQKITLNQIQSILTAVVINNR